MIWLPPNPGKRGGSRTTNSIEDSKDETESTISFDIGLARQPPLYGTQGGSSLSSSFSLLAIQSSHNKPFFLSIQWLKEKNLELSLTDWLGNLGDRCKRRWSCCWPSLNLSLGSRNAQSGFPLLPTKAASACCWRSRNGLPPFLKLDCAVGMKYTFQTESDEQEQKEAESVLKWARIGCATLPYRR